MVKYLQNHRRFHKSISINQKWVRDKVVQKRVKTTEEVR